MTVCQFFLQGRCRFGDRCWNEHPGARGAAGARQPPPAGSNRHGWNASNQRFSNVIQPSNFSRGPWGGSRDPDRASLGSSTSGGFGVSQSSFASLSSGVQDDQKMVETIIKDAEIWESSGQWMFSVYSPVKMKPIPGFTDISPEELRLEYHNFLTSNNLQSYFNSVQQLISQWKHKITELKSLNMSNKAALLSILGFGFTQASTFGSPGFSTNNSSNGSVKNFSFKASPGFAPSTSGSPSVFGSRPAFGAASTTGSAVSGLGKPQVTSAASFSFKTPAASGFGSPGFSAFSASTAGSSFGPAVPPAFGSGGSVPGFGSPGSHSHSAFSKPSNNVFGGSSTSNSHRGADAISAADKALFTPKDQLTEEELEQFKSKKFTLGKIPLKPPPVELIRI